MLVETFRRLSEKHNIFWVIFGVITLTMFGPWEAYLYRGAYRNVSSYVYVEPIHLPENTLVKFYGSMTSFMIPELAKYNKNFKSVTHYGYPYNGLHSDCAERGKFRKMRDQIEKKHKGPIVVILNKNQYVKDSSYYGFDVRDKFLERVPNTGLDHENTICRMLTHNFAHVFYICMERDLIR